MVIIGITALVQMSAFKFIYIYQVMGAEDFVMKETVSTLLLIWVVVLAILVDIIISGIFDNFWAAFSFNIIIDLGCSISNIS